MTPKITSVIVIGALLIVSLAVILYLLDFSLNVVMGIGGVVASGLLFYHMYKYGIKGRHYEWLAAFAWLIFSLLSFIY